MRKLPPYSDIDFVMESNAIEGIYREPTQGELDEYHRFMSLSEVTVDDLKRFVYIYQPNALLRDHSTISGVRVGSHIAPPSGLEIVQKINVILDKVNKGADPFDIHMQYETIHPFTDGNGRSGRMLWLWMMQTAPLGFLHTWYYQSLSNKRQPDVSEEL